MREGGAEGQHRMKMERPGVWRGWFWEGTCGHTYGRPFPSMPLSYRGVPVMESLAGPGVPPRGLCNRCNPFSKHVRLLCFASNRKLKSPLMQSD